MLFRTDVTVPMATQHEPMQYPFAGSKFDITNATVMHIFFTSVALGFLNYFSIFFPKNIISTDAIFAQDVADMQQWLKEVFDNQRKKATKPDLFNALEKMIFV